MGVICCFSFVHECVMLKTENNYLVNLLMIFIFPAILKCLLC